MSKNKEYYENLDKRTSEYKEWKKNFDKDNSTGLGDVIETITEKTGVKKAVKFIAGEDCGCDKRKKKANKIRFKHGMLRCLTEKQYYDWKEFIERSNKTNKVEYNDQINVIIPIYAHLFARQLKPMSCCLEPYINEINKVYELYK